ncbi:hypothetical protein N7501_009404 [Penicillium viridicatum]|nr:hypothetical protein N7501_009404 [Penicillium viridicatum]
MFQGYGSRGVQMESNAGPVQVANNYQGWPSHADQAPQGNHPFLNVEAVRQLTSLPGPPKNVRIPCHIVPFPINSGFFARPIGESRER